MKLAEHQRIMRKVVQRKNDERQAIEQSLMEEVEFWQADAAYWADRAVRFQVLIDAVLVEFSNLQQRAQKFEVSTPADWLVQQVLDATQLQPYSEQGAPQPAQEVSRD